MQSSLTWVADDTHSAHQDKRSDTDYHYVRRKDENAVRLILFIKAKSQSEQYEEI